jgi:hypothetical protein
MAPEDIDASSGEGNNRLSVALSFASFSVVEGPAFSVSGRAEGSSEENVFKVVVGVPGAAQVSGFAGLARDRGEPRAPAGGGKRRKSPARTRSLAARTAPMPGQANDEGADRVARDELLASACEVRSWH